MQIVKSKKYLKTGINYYQFENLGIFPEICHFISGKKGGISKGNYHSLNLSYNTADNKENVIENRKRLFTAMEIPHNEIVSARQVHGNNVEIIESGRQGCGAFSDDTAIPVADAMITAEKGICLFILVADCVPVLLLDKKQKVIAAVHAGWRGTVKRITGLAVRKMIAEFNCLPENILAGIGPSIGPCCYKVGNEVVKRVGEVFGTTGEYILSKDNQPHFDLWHANYKELTDIGIPAENIELSRICTCCHPEDFFSSRHDKGITGRFGAGIMIRKKIFRID